MIDVIYNVFKTESYRKGTYLTVEGKTNGEEAKIFVIYKGECRVEKNLSIEINNSHDSSRSFMYSNTVPIQIAVVGRGMIVGEEVLTTKDEYCYSVKVITTNFFSVILNYCKGNIGNCACACCHKEKFQVEIFSHVQ